jgi:DNA-directed RNA polymerase specialized sigma24 family protein
MRSGPPDERLAELLVQAELTAARLVGRVDAEDIASEAVVRAVLRWRRVSDFPHAWVTRVATNLAVDLLRKRARARSRSEMDRTPPGGFESVVAQRLEVVRVNRPGSGGGFC